MLSACTRLCMDLYVLIDYCYVSVALLKLLSSYIMLVAKHSQLLLLNYPLLILSRMVRPGGRGRAPERPPPPDYMAAMMQQFELNR
jgi:hypothetical protein